MSGRAALIAVRDSAPPFSPMTKQNSKSPKTRRAPLCVRLSDQERAKLEKRAAKASLTLSAYSRERLLSDDAVGDLLPHETRQKLLAQILALLGQSGYAKSLATLSDAANTGLLVLSPEEQALIADAYGQITDIHDILLRALGLRPGTRP